MPLQASDQLHVQFDSAPPSSSTDEVNDAIKCDENSDVTFPTNAPPTACRAQSPKTMHEPPAATTNRMKQHNVIETLLKSTSTLTSPPSIGMPTNKETHRDANNESMRDDTRDNKNSSSKKKHFNSNQHKQKQQRTYSSAASLVVCGVDGTVFTLDAYTGQLRGMFTSGPALVFSSDAVRDQDVDNMDENHESTGSIIQAPRPWKERVVPGLDGRLYSLYEHTDQDDYDDDEEHHVSECKAGSGNDDFLDDLCNSLDEDDHDNLNEDYSSSSVTPRTDRYNLQPLPISIMDVVDSPISTCRPVMNFDEAFEGVQKQQCGIVVGSKKTTVYAIDPMTGKVRWTQDPHGAGGAKGYTTGRPADDGTKPTVLLQREDYAARHLDTDGGDEVWKVELGRFSALDFDIDAHKQNVDQDNDDPIVVGGTGRGAAAAAATKDIKDKQRAKIPPILAGGSKKFGSLRDDSPEFESDDFEFNYEHSTMYRAFPSIAFGEDGTSVLAVDSISGELLWKRQIESVVAAVYGVGKASTWIPLDVVDEAEVLTHVHQQAGSLLPSSSASISSHNSGGLIPYGENNLLADQAHRLGRHRDHLFVSSKYDPLGMNPPPFLDSGIMDDTPSVDDAPNYIEEHSDVYDNILPPKQAPLSSQVPYSMPVDVTPPVSHRTEHGLYLTWSMISTIMVLLLSLIVYARLYYLRQKRKWENTPTLAPATAPNSYENGATDLSMSPHGNFLTSTIFADEKRSFPGNSWNDISTQPPARSLSMGAIGKQAEISGVSFIPEKSKDLSTANSPKPDSTSVFRQGKEVHSLAGVPATTPPTVTRSLTVPTDEEPKQPDLVDEVDGVPLVRYSRYRSEFKELSALGRGGFGTVFKCENNLDGREYAIKKIWIKSQITDGKIATKNFSQRLHRVLREVKILALLDHPNIVRYYTAWLEVDNEDAKPDDCESNMTSSRASPSIFSALGSASRGHSLIFKAGGNLFSSYMPKSNPLGWNNFASFRLDESKSTSKLPNVNENTLPSSDASHDDDLGFVWERSGENSLTRSSPAKQTMYPMKHDLKEENEESSSNPSSVSSVDSKESTEEENPHNLNAKTSNHSESKHAIADNNTSDNKTPTFKTERRHVLYIQMQLCSVQTLADFLGNREARMGPAESSSRPNCYAVDIPYALRLFSQITHGVKYVHKQGLIHRDLKPQNCFIDDSGIAKVGDFGLSRESSSVGGISGAFDERDINNHTHSVDVNTIEDAYGGDEENTAGVGTRAYASPEQMKGSNYDASTDIYSLGIILFEMCYPLYTTHERYKEFCGIRKGQYPSYWNSNIKIAFPSLHDLLTRMLSPIPANRPSAADVSEHIDKMLAEYSVQSLDKSWGKRGAILLRVEADEAEGVLSATMRLIKAAAPHAVILQYGLRGQTSKAIMEFAIEINHEEETSLDRISSSLRNSKMIVRQISSH